MSQPASTPPLFPNDLEEPRVTDANLWLGSSASYEALANGFELRIPEWFNMADATVGRHARGIFLIASHWSAQAVRKGRSKPSLTANSTLRQDVAPSF